MITEQVSFVVGGRWAKACERWRRAISLRASLRIDASGMDDLSAVQFLAGAALEAASTTGARTSVFVPDERLWNMTVDALAQVVTMTNGMSFDLGSCLNVQVRESDDRSVVVRSEGCDLRVDLAREWTTERPTFDVIVGAAQRHVVAPPLSVMRRRLYVRTEKAREFLTASQQMQAEQQLGSAWHSGDVGAPIVRLDPSSLQRRYLALKRKHRAAGARRFIVLKYRRGGFTTVEQALSYSACVDYPGMQCATLAHTRDSTTRIFRMVDLFHRMDPSKPVRVNESSTAFEFANGSWYFTGTAGGRGFSRGDALSRVHASEVSRWCQGPNQDRDVGDLIAGLQGAAQHGEITLESTPNGTEWFCRTYRAAKRGENSWVPIFFAWFDDRANRLAEGTFDSDEIRETMTEGEKSLVIKHDLSPSQLAWRREQSRAYGGLFMQEFPEDDESCFLAEGRCFFDVDAIVETRSLPLDPIETRSSKGWVETVWERPIGGVEYVAGCDTSEGIPGCDMNGFIVLRRDTGRPVCDVHGLMRPDELGRKIAQVCRAYNQALVGIERVGYGHAVIKAAAEQGYGNSHLHGGPMYFFQPDRAGWDTNAVTRPVMLDDLSDALIAFSAQGLPFGDAELLSECLTFRQQSSGKFSADSGAHDDRVMKWAVAWQMRSLTRARPRFVELGGERKLNGRHA